MTHMGSMTYVACTPWSQRHGAWYSLPHPCICMRTLKDLCIESIGEAMGVMPWLDAVDNWLDKKL